MIDVTAVVVGFNEGRILSKCIASLYFCKKVVYLDLGSSDRSLEIAKSFPNVEAQIIAWVPAVEKIHSELKKYTDSEWVLILDPDEVIDPSLSKALINDLGKIVSLPQVGSIEVPEIYYFKRKQLAGGIWGGTKYRTLIVNQRRFTFTNSVHSGRQLNQGFKAHRIELDRGNIVHHYWSNSYFQLFRKHKRYLLLEGPSRFSRGQRIQEFEIRGVPINEFKAAYWTLGGKQDGVSGLILAVLWGWYQWEASKALFREQVKSELK